MSRLSKDALLSASDLVEREVELDTIGGSVLVRSLPAAYSNQAMSEALEVATGARGQQTARVNTGKLEMLQVMHGMIDPKLNSLDEVLVFAQKCGAAWRKVVDTIDEISGVNKEAMEQTAATFQPGGPGTPGHDLGNGASRGEGAD